MADHLNWGILGTGAIANAFASHLPKSSTGKLVAVASRTKDKADAFGEKHRIDATHRHASYEALLADDSVHAVYIATPHPMHIDWAVRAAQARKHILVEKPIALNYGEAMAIIEAAADNDVFLMEAFMYRCHPQTLKLIELLRERAIGEVRVIHATFSFQWPIPYNTTSRLTNAAMGGGGILDVGGYPMSMARLIAGVATNDARGFAEPLALKAVGHVGDESRVDEWTIASLKFPGEIVAQLSCGVQVAQESSLRIDGSEGSIFLPKPWVPARDGGQWSITLTKRGEDQPKHITGDAPPIYAIEADTVARYVAQRQSPTMSWADSLGNIRALDKWRGEIGVVYDVETPDGFRESTLSRRPLKFATRNKPTMKYGRIAGIEKDMSRLIMGCDNQLNFPWAAAVFDDFFERGGNAYDTAHIYQGGLMERLLGQWIRKRGVREQVVVIAKGAHTPFCDPVNLSLQLQWSLERLGTDYADLYLMHRDNPGVPVGEFVEVMNEHVRAGRICAFGGSNWSLPRVDEANEYARSHGLMGFAAVSNNFSLARMVAPPWGGCITASDASSREWFARTRTPLLAWSSQARGFFLPGRAAPEKHDDEELVRCWYADDNFQRLNRVNELARKRNVEPINIALAYVLAQPFPTFALIGPRAISETRSSFAALEIELSADELKWLNLEQ